MKLNRLLSILLLIESKGQVTAKELSGLFEVSVRTIYRDIDILCEAGVPIYSEFGPKGGYAFMEGYNLESKTLDQQEMESLLLSIINNRMGKKAYVSEKLLVDPLLLKLSNSLPKSEQENYKRLIQKIKTDATSWWGSENRENEVMADSTIEIIQKSIYQLKPIAFDYKKYKEMTFNRVLHPYGLVHKGEAWYVIGYSVERQQVRTFHTERMQNLRLLDESYALPEDFNLEEYWDRATRAFVKQVSSDRTVIPESEVKAYKYPVKIRMHSSLTHSFEGFNIFNRLEDEYDLGYTILSIDLISEKTAVNALLPYLDGVKVMEPTEFREKILELLKKMISNQNP